MIVGRRSARKDERCDRNSAGLGRAGGRRGSGSEPEATVVAAVALADGDRVFGGG